MNSNKKERHPKTLNDTLTYPLGSALFLAVFVIILPLWLIVPPMNLPPALFNIIASSWALVVVAGFHLIRYLGNKIHIDKGDND